MAFNKSKQQTNLKGAESTIIVITFNGVLLSGLCLLLLPFITLAQHESCTRHD